MKPIEIEAYYHNEETERVSSLDIEFHITQCEVRLVTFYNISAISKAIEDDGFEYGIIHVGNTSFSVVPTYEQLKQLLL